MSDVPRYVVSITDTKTIVPGPDGDQYYSVQAAADTTAQYFKPLPKKDQQDGKNEIERMFKFFQEAIDKLEANAKVD